MIAFHSMPGYVFCQVQGFPHDQIEVTVVGNLYLGIGDRMLFLASLGCSGIQIITVQRLDAVTSEPSLPYRLPA